MARTQKSIDQLANATARQAQSEAAMLQRDIRALSDNLSRLSRAVKAPVPTGGSRTIKGSRSSLNPLFGAELNSVTKYLVGGALGGDDSDASGSFYSSQAQIAGGALGDLATGQRIR
jgi:hypothetical protein